MPLPFATAENGPRTAVPAAPPPWEREKWRRPYRPGPWRVGAAALLLLFASCLLAAAAVAVLAGAPVQAGACAACAVLVVACVLRMLRVGVWVCSRGIRQVELLSTATLPWAEVAAVRTVQQPVRWLGLPRSVQGQALLVLPRGREALRALLTDHSADFLARPDAFDRAADAVKGWAAEQGRP